MKVTTEEDRSRNGYLVHYAVASGRIVRVVVYIEGIADPRREVETSIVCRTAMQASEIARVLREAKTSIA